MNMWTQCGRISGVIWSDRPEREEVNAPRHACGPCLRAMLAGHACGRGRRVTSTGRGQPRLTAAGTSPRPARPLPARPLPAPVALTRLPRPAPDGRDTGLHHQFNYPHGERDLYQAFTGRKGEGGRKGEEEEEEEEEGEEKREEEQNEREEWVEEVEKEGEEEEERGRNRMRGRSG